MNTIFLYSNIHMSNERIVEEICIFGMMMVCALHSPFQVLVTKCVLSIMYIPTPSGR